MLTFGMQVYGQDGELGKLRGVVIDLKSREAKWLLASRNGILWDSDARLITTKHITTQNKKGLYLNHTQWDYSVSRTYLRMDDRRVGVPLNMIICDSQFPMRGKDGFIGRLKGIELDADHRCITQLLIKGEWVLGQEWIIPAVRADVLNEEEIHLNRSRPEIRHESSRSTPMAHASSGA